MTTTPDTIATMHPADLRSAWRGRRAAKLFSTAPGTRSCQIRKSAVVWSWRPNDTHPRVASTVHVYREGGQLFIHVSDHVPGKHDRVVSRRQRLRTWAELERAVGMLVDGEPLVPRIPCACGGPAALVSYGDRGTRGPLRRICADCSATGTAMVGGL